MSGCAIPRLAALCVAMLASAASAGAVEHEVRILLDLDDDPGTGCLVNTVEGPFDGVEQVLITTVETTTSPDAGTVTDAAISDCIDSDTGTFGVPASFDGGWPVGVGNGEGGRDVVETYFPLVASVVDDPRVVRLGVVVTDEQGGEEALLTVDDTPGGDPIVLDLQSVLEIPTLGEWGLILLVLLLAGASVVLLGRRGTVAFAVALVVLSSGVVWAAGVLDGLTDDWSSADLLASNGLVLFGKGAAGELCFRVDVDLLFNQAPTITDIADQTIPEDGTTGPLAFTVDDFESPATSLTVTATSSNQLLVPDANLALGGSGANRTIDVTPAADQNGMTDVTVTVEDPDGGTASTTFRVTVTSENDPPTITAIADQTIDEDTSTGPLGFTVDDVETPPGSLTVTASSDDQTIIPDGNLVLGGTDENRTIEVTPAPDQNGGPVTITVTVMDGDGGSVTEQFDVTVTPVNDPPTISAIADQTIDEDTSTGALAFTIDDIDDPVGSLTVSAASSDQTLIPDGNLVIGGAAPNLTVEATPAPDENGGPATITVTATDPDGAPAVETFDVTVTPVNDPPTVVNSTISYAAVGNTLLRAPGNDPDHDGGVPGRIASTSDPDDAFVKAGPSDIDSAGVGFQAGTFPTTNSGSLTIDDDGDFHYTPPTGVTGFTDDVVVNVADTEGLTTPVTIEIAVNDLVWYVEDTTDATKNPAGGPGTSRDAFETLGAAETASGEGDFILVFETDGVLDEGIALKSGQKLYGQPVKDEATPLLPGGLVLEAIADTGARPVISPDPDTDAVSVAATGENLVDVEIRHLELSGAASGNAIDVTSTDPHAIGVTIADNRIAGSEKEGIDLNPGSSGGFTVTVENNTFSTSSPTGNAIDVTTAAGNSADVEVAIDGNTDVRSGFDTAIHLDGSQGTGTLIVTSFANNTVHGNTGGAGVVATDVTFDADPSTGAFDEVAAGTWSIGENGNAVDAGGMLLGTPAQEVEGHLSFTQLDVFAGGGAGLDVAGSGLFTGTTGFQLEVATGTVEAAGGPGVVIDPATLGITFDSVTSPASSTTGISLIDVAGTFSATGGSLATTGLGSGPTFQVGGGSVDASYGGSVASAEGQSVQVENMTGGTVTLSGPVDDDGAGISITGNDAGTSVAFNGGLDLATTVNTAFTATGDGEVTVASLPTNTISTTTGAGVLVNGVDAGGDFDFDTVTVSNGGAEGISIQSSAGTKTFGLIDVTNSGGAGLFASNAGTVSVTNGASSIATTGQPAVDADNTTFGATFASLTSTGSATTGIDLASVGGSFTATSVTIDGTTGAGVQLTGNSATVALNGGTIGATTTTTGNAVDVDGGAANVTIDAAIANSAARSVEVTNRSGGTVTISGAIDDTGTGINVASNSAGSTTFSNASKVINTGSSPAVTLANNGSHTVNFTGGGLDIETTSGAGFSATVSGTVNVTGAGNTVNTTTGTGVNIANVTIGASDATFESVSSDGASAGIVLDTTGTTGDFEVTGDGASSTADTTAGRTTAAQGGGSLVLGSGGTITNTTDGVRLTSATDVVLRNMVIGEGTAAPGDAVSGTTVITDNGIEATSVTNLVLDNVLISQTGDHGIEGFGSNVGLTLIHTEILNAGDDGAGPTDGDDAMDFNTGSGAPLTGAVSIQSSILAGMSDTGLEVENFSGDLDLTVTDSFIGNNDHSDASCNPCEGDGFLLRADGGSATIDMVVRDTTFNDIANDGIDLGNDQATNVSTLIAENLVGTNNSQADNLIDTANTNGTLRARITDLSSDSAHRGTVLFFKADGAATTDVTINNSTIQGSAIGNGIEVFIDGDPGTGPLGDGNARVLVQNTQLSNIFSMSIDLNVQDMPTGSSTAGFLDATLENVTTAEPLRDGLFGSVRGVASSGAGNGATLQLQITDSLIGLGSFSSTFGFRESSLVLMGDSNIDIACVDDGNTGNGTPCTNIGITTSDDGLIGSIMNENGNQVADGGARAFAGADVFTSGALRNTTGEVLIISPTEVTDPTLP